MAAARKKIAISEILRLAIESFRAARVRFVLTALGMTIGTASVILVVTISNAGKQYILAQIEAVGSNLIELEYAGAGTGSVGNVKSDFLTFADEGAIDSQVPSIASSSVVLEMYQRITLNEGRLKNVIVLGVEPEYVQVRNLVLLAGRFFDDEDEATHAKVAVVTESFAREMFGSPGDAINRTFQISGIPVTIVGTFRERVDTFGETEISNDTILIPYSVARYFSGTDNVNGIYFSLRDENDIEASASQIEAVAKSRHLATSAYKTTTLTALLTTAAHIMTALSVMLALLCAVMLTVGGVGIMNIMLATVQARTREIGIRKALGATALEIRLQFLLEAVLVSLFGGVIGAFIGLGLPFSINIVTGYHIPMSAWSVAVGLLTSAAVGVLFGTLPASRAAAMDPIESLRFE
jgi:putative ABC transport system permease protein